MAHDQELAAPLSPGLRNPNKLANLRPGQGAEGRRKHVRSIANKLRRFLESPRKTALDRDGRKRLQRIFDTLLAIATDPEHPHAVSAAQLLLDRAYGKVRPSEEEIDGARTGEVQIVIVNRPTGLPKYVEPPPLDAPKFREGEIVPNSFCAAFDLPATI